MLGIALVGGFVVGAAVVAVLLVIFVIGYCVSLAHSYWRLGRLRERAAYLDHSERAGYNEGDFEVVAAIADTAPRGPGGSA